MTQSVLYKALYISVTLDHKTSLKSLENIFSQILSQICGLSQVIFVQKSSIVWCHYDYLSAPDRDGVSLKSYRKYQTCLIITTLDRSAPAWDPRYPMKASKRHSPDVVCFYSGHLAAPNMPWKQRTSPICFSTLCFSLWNRMRAMGVSWQHRLSCICFSSLVTFDLSSLCEITCCWEIVPTIFKCAVSWSGRII